MDNTINNGVIDPVNHQLQQNELDVADYAAFLDELTDVPSSIPLQPFSINKAGIVNQFAYITVRSLFSEEYVPVYCKVGMQVSLQGHRGIHMSRCEEALFELVDQRHESLESFASQLAKRLQEVQSAEAAYVELEGFYLANRKTVKTQRTSHDRLILTVECHRSHATESIKIGMTAFNMTACPCTRTYTKFAVVPKLREMGLSLDQIRQILSVTNSGTHTQRGLATIVLDKNADDVTHGALYTILNESCHLVFELLKRPDEHDLVVRALQRPQFTEDVAREIAQAALSRFGETVPSATTIAITSTLFDSIHIHDVYTEITSTFGELITQIRA